EYKRSDFGALVRGKYIERLQTSSNVVVLDPEVADLFPNAAAVNAALRPLAEPIALSCWRWRDVSSCGPLIWGIQSPRLGARVGGTITNLWVEGRSFWRLSKGLLGRVPRNRETKMASPPILPSS